jgi:hypothetical protein
LVNLTFVAGTIALLVWLGNVNFIGGTTALWIGGIVVVLALLNVGYATVRLPFFWPNWSKAKSEIQEKWAAMLLAYAAFAGPALSIQHLRKLVEDSSQEGVVWPSTLFVLLDDLEKRGVQAV